MLYTIKHVVKNYFLLPVKLKFTSNFLKFEHKFLEKCFEKVGHGMTGGRILENVGKAARRERE